MDETAPASFSFHDPVKDNDVKKRTILPIILIIAGIMEAILPLAQVATVVPKLSALYSELGVNKYSPIVSYGLLGLMIVIALAGAVYGGMLVIEQRKTGTVTKPHRKVALALLIAGVVAGIASVPITLLTVIYPIYNITSEF